MKNNYAQRLADRKAAEMAKANEEGFIFHSMLTTVALNNLYGFGEKRIGELEKEIDRIVVEEFGRDGELAAHTLKRRVDTIRGVK